MAEAAYSGTLTEETWTAWLRDHVFAKKFSGNSRPIKFLGPDGLVNEVMIDAYYRRRAAERPWARKEAGLRRKPYRHGPRKSANHSTSWGEFYREYPRSIFLNATNRLRVLSPDEYEGYGLSIKAYIPATKSTFDLAQDERGLFLINRTPSSASPP